MLPLTAKESNSVDLDLSNFYLSVFVETPEVFLIDTGGKAPDLEVVRAVIKKTAL